MRRPETPFAEKDSAGEQALCLAMKLSNRQWKLGFTDRRHKIRRVTIELQNLVVLRGTVNLVRKPSD